MVEFHPIQLSDRTWIGELFRLSQYRGSEYCFSNSYNWRKAYQIECTRLGNRALIRSDGGHGRNYLYPAGDGDLKEAILAMKADADKDGLPFRLNGVTDEMRDCLEENFPDAFEFSERRDQFDYIYSVDKLSSLSGKKLHGKRNHINRFLETYDWRFEPLTLDNLPYAFERNQQWKQSIAQEGEDNQSLDQAGEAVKSAFDHFTDLGLKGGLLIADGRPVAYTMGSPLTEDTFIVHIEKAFWDVPGAYPMINQQFVRYACEGFTYVNREDDTGDEGLRKAKQSYYPDILLRKFHAVWRG